MTYILDMGIDYTGQYFDIDFINGKGKTENEQIVAYFNRHKMGVKKEIKRQTKKEK